MQGTHHYKAYSNKEGSMMPKYIKDTEVKV